MTISSFRTPQNTKLPLQIDARHRCVDSCSIQYRSFADGLPSQTRVLTKIIMDRTSKAFGRDPCYSEGVTQKVRQQNELAVHGQAKKLEFDVVIRMLKTRRSSRRNWSTPFLLKR
jgi:hypothetical protein